jgi:hypothetical protein
VLCRLIGVNAAYNVLNSNPRNILKSITGKKNIDSEQSLLFCIMLPKIKMKMKIALKHVCRKPSKVWQNINWQKFLMDLKQNLHDKEHFCLRMHFQLTCLTKSKLHF